MLKNWTDEHTESFGKKSFTVEHSLKETGLFTDEALADLLDKHPRSHLDVCTMADHDLWQAKFRTGDVRNVDGKTLIEAARAGSIWMNLRQAMNMHPEYKIVLDKMYSQLAQLSGAKHLKPRGGILITCPTAETPYHFDPTDTILWHVRGQKTMYLYPRTEEYLPDEYFERVLFCDNEDYLPYNKKMDEGATKFNLTDNQMISWPLNAPHRVENSSYCVSVTAEYSSPESTFKNAVMYTHAVMRRKAGMNPSWRRTSYPSKMVKAITGRMLRKMGVLSSLKEIDTVTFTVDKNAPGYILDTAPFLRDF